MWMNLFIICLLITGGSPKRLRYSESSSSSEDIEPRLRRTLPALSVTAASGGPIAVAGATLAIAIGGATVAGSVVSSLITWGVFKDSDVLQAIERICAGKEEFCLRKLNLPDRSKRHLRHRRQVLLPVDFRPLLDMLLSAAINAALREVLQDLENEL
ncbi:hypothetical protein QR680_011680 [Steinernema hermaphroditum]|uniref:Uncharacterized protein n=1 Tax=Steinernema hermaphroditum TaxID=289476 RepID=A0AA39I204_9BILA|nr:hypothetical protein QR680_011680 [Steinernema hermaphroditum]